MGLLLLVPGLVLWLTNGWFAQQHKVGAILTVIGCALLALQLFWFAFVASKVKSTFDEVRRRPPSRF